MKGGANLQNWDDPLGTSDPAIGGVDILSADWNGRAYKTEMKILVKCFRADHPLNQRAGLKLLWEFTGFWVTRE
jgi:hypothetical protein